jgi:hypothetical protein
VRKLTGFLNLGGGISWQYFGDAAWDNEEGVSSGFPFLNVRHAVERFAQFKQGLRGAASSGCVA